MPSFYLDRLPSQPYRSVDIIEVIASAGTELSAVMRAALEKGQELGCLIVVDRSIHQVRSRELVQGWHQQIRIDSPRADRRNASPRRSSPSPLMSDTYRSPPQLNHREFICGVFDEQQKMATPGAAVPAPAASAAKCRAGENPAWKDARPEEKKKMIDACR